jgi:undecaprenyl diphosphate synthase
MQAAEALTAGNTRLQLSIAASYGGRQDIAQAARALAEMLLPDACARQVTRTPFRACAGRPAPPDLFIRTGGELRMAISVAARLHRALFTDALWPT